MTLKELLAIKEILKKQSIPLDGDDFGLYVGHDVPSNDNIIT
jgi:hypothetical protein